MEFEINWEFVKDLSYNNKWLYVDLNPALSFFGVPQKISLLTDLDKQLFHYLITTC